MMQSTINQPHQNKGGLRVTKKPRPELLKFIIFKEIMNTRPSKIRENFARENFWLKISEF